jgi:hypothetical protein
MSRVLRVACAAAALGGLWALGRTRARPESAVLALDSAEAAAFCEAVRFPRPEFLERARAAGVRAALMRPQTIEEASRERRLMHVTRDEEGKMRGLGLLPVRSPMKEGSVWSRDKGDIEVLEELLELRDFKASAVEHGGLFGLQLPGGVRPESFTAGYDRRDLCLLRSKGLNPVFLARDAADARTSGEGILLVTPSFQGALEDPGRRIVAFADDPDSALGSLARGERSRRLDSGLSPERAVLAWELGAGEGPASLREGLLRRGGGLAIVRLDRSRGVEENFERIRSLAAVSREEGFAPWTDAPEGGRKAVAASVRWLAYLAALACSVLGAMAGMRKGLGVLRSLSARDGLPEASPLLEVGAGALCAAAASSAAGLALRAVLCLRECRLGAFPPGLEAAGFSAAFVVGLFALYPLGPRSTFRLGTLARGAAAAAGCACVAWPSVAGSGWSSRFPGAAAGFGALFLGFWMWREDRFPRGGVFPGRSDPRPWMLAGLLSLCGSALAFASAEPVPAVLRGRVVDAGLGILIGLGLAGMRLSIVGKWARRRG